MFSGDDDFTFRPIGVVRSALKSRKGAPRQGSEGAPDAFVEVDKNLTEALVGLSPGDEVLLLTWLHLGHRDVLQVYPRGDRNNGLFGVFATRSPDRPNPIGLHRVRILEIDGTRLSVDALEAVDGTPVLDIKPVLPTDGR